MRTPSRLQQLRQKNSSYMENNLYHLLTVGTTPEQNSDSELHMQEPICASTFNQFTPAPPRRFKMRETACLTLRLSQQDGQSEGILSPGTDQFCSQDECV